jgi:hypothetical protein
LLTAKDCIVLVGIAIVVLAGGIASGLGQVAMGTSYRDNFPMVFGSGIMVVGSILFVIQLLILKCKK